MNLLSVLGAIMIGASVFIWLRARRKRRLFVAIDRPLHDIFLAEKVARESMNEGIRLGRVDQRQEAVARWTAATKAADIARHDLRLRMERRNAEEGVKVHKL